VNGLGVLQRILNDLSASMDAGGVLLHPILMGYLGLFALFALVWTCYGLLWNGHAFASGLNLLIRLALVTLAIDRWGWFLEGLEELALSLGLQGTGNTLQLSQFLDPGALVKAGIDSGAVLWKAFQNNLGLTSFVTGLAYLFAWLAFVGAYMVMAYKVFWWQVEALIASLAGMVLLPTLAFRPLGFVAMGVLSYAANMFARFLLGAMLAGALWNTLNTLTAIARPGLPLTLTGVDFTIQEAFYAAALAAVLAACFLSVNRLAGALTSGVPGMAGGNSVGTLLRMVTVGAAGLLTGGAGVATGLLGAGRVAAGSVQGLIGAGQAVRLLTSGGGGTTTLGGAARQVYAGTRSGMSGGVQARLGTYMGQAQQVGDWGGQHTLRQLMQSRQGGDQAHGGVRR